VKIGIDVRKIRDTGIGTYIRNIITRMLSIGDDEKEFVLFGHPGDRDYLNLPVSEAMAKGVPVVASGVSSHPEVAGDAALMVDPEDHRGAAEAMIRIVTNREERDSFIRRGLERARLFTWDETARKTLACYREVRA